MRTRAKRILLDAGVPVSIGKHFQDAGWFVIHYFDVLAEKAPDDVVCLTAIENEAVLIAVDNDMKRIVRRYATKRQKNRYSQLDLILFGGSNVRAVSRSFQAISFINHEWQFAVEKPSRRLWIEISDHYMRTNR